MTPSNAGILGTQALRLLPVVVGGLLASCSFNGAVSNGLLGSDDAGTRGDASSSIDAKPVPDAQPPAPDAPIGNEPHLLLSEVKTRTAKMEFIEIYNPGTAAVDLSNYYLSDTQSYASLPSAFSALGSPPSVSGNDFIMGFPNGSSLAAGAVTTVGIVPRDFFARYARNPDYAIGPGANPLVPNMRKPFAKSLGKSVFLTDSGEVITLFYWDGASDLVTDVDIFVAGDNASPQNELKSKTGVRVDGPDDNVLTSLYRDDLKTLPLSSLAADSTHSYTRIAAETAANETQLGTGNGMHGHDETSENTALTWDVRSPTPGVLDPAL